MKKLFSLKTLYSTLFYFTLFCSTTFAVKMEIPEGNWESDVILTPQETQVQWKETDIFKLIQIINKYLWFSIGGLCMVGLVVGGFKLISSQGEEEWNKKASVILKWSVIGLLIAISSYAIVRLVVNLF